MYVSQFTAYNVYPCAYANICFPVFVRWSQDVGSVLVSCFVLEGTLNEDLTSASKLLTQLLGANTQDKMNPE